VPRGSGLRFAVEATFLVIVAIVAVTAHFHWPAIILVMVLAWILVSAVEVAISRRGAPTRVEATSHDTERAAEVDIPQHVRVLAAEAAPPPKPAPPVPVVVAPLVTVEEPVPVVVPVPVPVAPVLVSVPAPPPPPEPVRAPEPVPAAPSVVTIASRDTRPREWNLWELERLTRESSGSDAAVDEERNYLLMYLREFANADGALPVDFDGLVRDSFGDLIGVA
jgi:hypothetical protein